jgi:predicted RNase H-like HicB family nuclease
MRNKFTPVVERHGHWHIAYCPDIAGANGQDKTKTAALRSLRDAIALILEARRRDGLRGVPAFRPWCSDARATSSTTAASRASSSATFRWATPPVGHTTSTCSVRSCPSGSIFSSRRRPRGPRWHPVRVEPRPLVEGQGLSKEQPFLDPEAERKRLERKDSYRALKAAGKL